MALDPISIITSYGPPLAGFKRPMTQESLIATRLDELVDIYVIDEISELYVMPGVLDAYPDRDPAFPPKGASYNVTGFYILSPPNEKFDDPLLEKIVSWMGDFFEGRPRFACDSQECDRIACELESVVTRNIGFNSTPLPEEFTDEALEILGISSREELAEMVKICPDLAPQRLSCTTFALLRALEPAVIEFLSFCNVEGILLELLPKWGYVPVLEPKVGDLVMYLKDGVYTHLGRYLGKGRVESKIGNTDPSFTDHSWEAVVDSYGDQVVFWRKEESTS